ncbi:MAG: aldehyde ferredoxin oxidoreductase [Nitrososphaeria archaeon]|nr:aldehyde ferredoxin oxidoreductase [Nitrososphaeria archaeon]
MVEYDGGYTGKILDVDLTKSKSVKRPLPKAVAHRFVGGIGFTEKMLFDELRPGIDPLGPENILIMATGPLNGTAAPTASRLVVSAKSPQSGFYGDSSVGGHFAPELKFAGYDLILFRGRADRPVFLWINDDMVEIMDGDGLVGMDTWELNDAIRKMTGERDISIAAIGPGGENMVRFACVMVDGNSAAGKTGMGAVMGSKNLKAVAVKGTQDVKIADPKRFQQALDEHTEILKNDPISSELAPLYGTTGLVTLKNTMGSLLTRNLQTGVFEDADKINGEAVNKDYLLKARSCFACPLRCDRYTAIKDGPYAGTCVQGPEYEALLCFGSRCGNSNLESILKANDMVNRYSLDVIGAGSVIAFAMECYEKGILTKKDTDGIDLHWGNHEAIIKIIEKIAFRKGFGDLLAEGTLRAAKRIGGSAMKYAMVVKGVDIDSGDPRVEKAYGLGYLTSPIGSHHTRSLAIFERIGTPELGEDMFGSSETATLLGVKGKGRLVVWTEHLNAILNMLGICLIGLGTMVSSIPIYIRKGIEVPTNLYSAVTGIETKTEDLIKAAERNVNLSRAFNVREGATRRDDAFPERFLKETMPDGPGKGHVFPQEELLDEYYVARGWEVKTGIPTKEKLLELGLHEAVEELERLQLLPDLAKRE